eukprot:COSAG02_NODE_12216_length_1578_cov_143.258959_1_plen_125_part_10
MRVRGNKSLAIIRRKGKILRDGLPTLRYDQFCVGKTSPDGLVQESGADVLYHVGGPLNEPPIVQRTQLYLPDLTDTKSGRSGKEVATKDPASKQATTAPAVVPDKGSDDITSGGDDDSEAETVGS